MDTTDFDFGAANGVLADLDRQMADFAVGLSLRAGLITDLKRQFLLEARYPFQVWDLEIDLPGNSLGSAEDLQVVISRFHEVHERTFAVKQVGQPLECQHWKGRLAATLAKPTMSEPKASTSAVREVQREAYFGALGAIPTRCVIGASSKPGLSVDGPAILEEPTMTVVVPPGARVTTTSLGNFSITTENHCGA